MENILIVSYLFAPENEVGAIRPTKLAKYISKSGRQVDVVTTSLKTDPGLFSSHMESVRHIFELDHSDTFLKLYNKIRGTVSQKYTGGQGGDNQKEIKPKSPFRTQMSLHFRQSLGLYRSYDFFCSFKKFVRRNREQFENYDAVFTTFGPIASVFCGKWLKKTLPEIKWVCDFRDPMVVKLSPVCFVPFYRHIQNKSCKKADVIVSISEGCIERICKEKYRYKAHVVTNGYDREDIEGLQDMQPSGALCFVYAGSLYEGKRKIEPLFMVLKELADQGKLDIGDIKFHYAGGDYLSLQVQARKYNMEQILINHGRLSRQDCLSLQAKSHFLVLSTWNNQGEEGVFTGKILEYMMMDKPIVAIVTGNKANSDVYQVIRQCQIGITYEQIQHREHDELLKEYILNQYQRYKKGLQLDFNPDRERITQYDYKNITDQILKLIDSQ